MSRTGSVTQLYNAILNGPAVQLTRYPIGAAGSALTGGGAAYAYVMAGNVQTIAAGTNTTGMWIAGGGINTPSAISEYILWIGRGTAGAAVRAAEIEFQALGTGGAAVSFTGRVLPSTVFLPIPLFVRAGVGICLNIATSAGGALACTGVVFVYTGLAG